MPITTYRQALDWLYGFARFDEGRRHIPGGGGLQRMVRLLERLGAPQTRFPCVLIAGAKGKGSTAAMLASILRAAGYRTGLYTSPHLHTFRERIRLDAILISQGQVVAGVQKLEELLPEFPDVIWFELVTAIAFDFFAWHDIDIAVLEVGLGGRLDPTNVVQPRVAVITPISYDHVDVLGTTLAAIAQEKAGIIKAGTPVVSAPQAVEARDVIEAIALDKHAPLTLVGRDLKYRTSAVNLDGETFYVNGGDLPQTRPFHIPLLGRHQVVNATTALAVADELGRQGWQIREEHLERGLATVEWPARLEILSRDPVIVADGAHNRASAHELVVALDDLFPQLRVHIVFGASDDKDIAGMFAEILPRAASLVLTRSRHARAASPEILRITAEGYGGQVRQTTSVASALEEARSLAGRQEVICVTGSLFVAAEARKLILEQRGARVETDEV